MLAASVEHNTNLYILIHKKRCFGFIYYRVGTVTFKKVTRYVTVTFDKELALLIRYSPILVQKLFFVYS